MADVKKSEKTAESGGIQNVAPVDNASGLTETGAPAPGGGPTTLNTAVRQAAATVPGSEAAAQEAMPSDDAVAKLSHGASPVKTFTQVRAEREALGLTKNLVSHEAYPNPNAPRDVKPSKRTNKEMDRGSQAQGDATHQQGDPKGLTKDNRAKGEAISNPLQGAISEEERNREAEEQMARVTEGVTGSSRYGGAHKDDAKKAHEKT